MLVPTALRLVAILNVYAKAHSYNDASVTILPNYGYMFILRTLTNSVIDVDVARTSARDAYYKFRRVIRFAAFCNTPPKSTAAVVVAASEKLPRYSSGELMKYSDVGLYPLYYIDSTHDVTCPDCANKAERNLPVDDFNRPIACGVNYEDADLYCQVCNKRIESAYAEDSRNEAEFTDEDIPLY